MRLASEETPTQGVGICPKNTKRTAKRRPFFDVLMERTAELSAVLVNMVRFVC